jgi:hypothetical protein
VAIIPTKLSTIFLSLKARLMSAMSFSDSQVLIDARDDSDDELPTIAPQYIRIRRKAVRPLVEESVDGIGRVNPRCLLTVSVWLWTRIALDKPQEDLLWLTKQSLGHLDGEQALWDALLCYQIVDEDDNWLVTEPIKPRQASVPRKSKKQKEWGRSGLDFDVTFSMILDQTYQ